MLKLISTPQGLATVTGVAILAASTNMNVIQTGGWFSSHALLVAALSAGVFAGARVVGMGSGKIGLVIIAALIAGEAFNFSATAERIVVERENGAAPLRDASAKHDSALGKLNAIEASAPASARLTLALAAQTKAQAAYEKELREGGRCKQICNGLKADAAKADAEVTAAATEAQKLHAAAIEAAKAEVEANPLPASATPLADRLGWAPWVLDLVMAGLLSVGANGLAGTLIAYGAHSVVALKETTELSPEQSFGAIKTASLAVAEPSPLVAMFAGELPDNPTPPKGTRRKRQLPKGVIDFKTHPVVKALKANGGSVDSHRQLAQLMGIDEGAATRRRHEVEDLLDICKVGKEMRIALKA